MTPQPDPARHENRSPLLWVIAALVVAIVVVIGLILWLGDAKEDQLGGTDAAADTTVATTAATTMPPHDRTAGHDQHPVSVPSTSAVS